MKQLGIAVTLEKEPKFVFINLTHLGMRRAFLGTCDIGGGLNMHIMHFLIIKP